MARDYTKYTVKGIGENLNKRQLVFEIVKDYVEKNNPSFDELRSVFKDEIQGSKGFIRKVAKVEDPKRFNTKMPLKIKFGVEVVVSNQWGSKNMDAFLSLAKKLKYKVSLEQSEIVEKDDSSPDIAEMNNSNDKNEGINHYTLIRVYKNENGGEDNPLDQSFVFKTNGEYVLGFTLSSDGDGVIDGWHFCDIKNNIFGSAASPWGFDEFTDADEEWIEEYDSFEDFGYDENEIGKEINKMRLEFVEKYLNEKSKDNLLYEAAVPDSKISHYKVDNDRLIFEDGDKNTIPELWSDWLEW